MDWLAQWYSEMLSNKIEEDHIDEVKYDIEIVKDSMKILNFLLGHVELLKPATNITVSDIEDIVRSSGDTSLFIDVEIDDEHN